MDRDDPRASQPPPRSAASRGPARRRLAAELFEAGVSQADVARRLEVSRQTAHRWHAIWTEGGEDALLASSRRGPHDRLTDDEIRAVGAALAEGPRAHGFADDRWKMDQVRSIIDRLTGITYHPSHVGRLVRRHGWPITPAAKPDPLR